MNGLAERLNVVHRDIRDQAEYLHHLVEQFDVPFDACCTLQMAVAELHALSLRLDAVRKSLPKPRKRRAAVGSRAVRKREP